MKKRCSVDLRKDSFYAPDTRGDSLFFLYLESFSSFRKLAGMRDVWSSAEFNRESFVELRIFCRRAFRSHRVDRHSFRILFPELVFRAELLRFSTRHLASPPPHVFIHLLVHDALDFRQLLFRHFFWVRKVDAQALLRNVAPSLLHVLS